MAVVGVTCCDPASLPEEPHAWQLPHSRIMSGCSGVLCIDGETGEECPDLRLSPPHTYIVPYLMRCDTYGISWKSDTLTRYYDGKEEFVWDVDIPDNKQWWGVVQMLGVDQISVHDTGKMCIILTVVGNISCLT